VWIFIATGMCLLKCCLATDIFSGSTIPVFKCHVTILPSTPTSDVPDTSQQAITNYADPTTITEDSTI
jgi:hypothetical protein